MSTFKNSEDYLGGGDYYLYRHIRNDKNEPFYVGVGKKTKNKTFEKIYMRAYSIKGRNRHWHSITKTATYDVDILMTLDSSEKAREKEIEFIRLYGRRDNKTGTLVNLTDGEDGHLNPAKEIWDLRKKRLIETGEYDKMIIRMKQYTPTKETIAVKTPMYIYNVKGEFIKKIESRLDASNELGLAQSTIHNYKDTNKNIKEYIIKSEYFGDKINIEGYSINLNRKLGNKNNCKRKIMGKPVGVRCLITNTKTDEVLEFDFLSEAAKYVGIHRKNFSKCLNNGKYKHYLIEKID